jgi:tetratricopeptide (TPR) repeat protein
MASQNWDDHNRSKRYITRDFGFNYLTTCEPGSVIFTMGDNDTFPLWYAQEVEGYRTDVRVCNLSYLQTDWYIDQMKRQSYESEPLPISWEKPDYIQGKHDVAYIIKQTDQPWEVSRALNRVKSDDLRTKRIKDYGIDIDNVPSEILYIPVDSAAVVAAGLVKPENADRIAKEMVIDMRAKKDAAGNLIEAPKHHLAKQEMMILDMLSNNKDWKRPFYYAITVSPDQFLHLNPYFRQDGVAYRILPFAFDPSEDRHIDTDVLYDNLINKYRWGNLEQEGLYLDENSSRMSRTFRLLFGILGKQLVAEGKKDMANTAMDYSLKHIPDYNVPYDYYSTNEIANTYLQIGEKEKAIQLYDILLERSIKSLNWYSRLKPREYASVFDDIRRELYYVGNILSIYREANPEKYEAVADEYDRYIRQFEMFNNSISRTRGGANR